MTIVEKIHAEVDAAEDILLKESQAIVDEKKQELADNQEQVKLMRELGFVNSDLVKRDTARLNTIVKSEEIANLILYYKQNYPFQRFLTVEKFDEICERYNLVYAPVSAYKEDVPVKNLKEIAAAKKLEYKDLVRPKWRLTEVKVPYDQSEDIVKWLLETEFDFNPLQLRADNRAEELCPFKSTTSYSFYWTHESKAIEIDYRGLFIAAPKDHFYLSEVDEIKKGKGWFQTKQAVRPDDPIVFRYVKGGIQVISKWGGPEADDPELTPGIFN